MLYPQGKIADFLLATDFKIPYELSRNSFVLPDRSHINFNSALLPRDENPVGNRPVDIASIASLTRNVVEAFNSFFFLCLDNVPEEEEIFDVLSYCYITG